MNTSTEHILQYNQSEPLPDASGRIVDVINENGLAPGGEQDGPQTRVTLNVNRLFYYQR